MNVELLKRLILRLRSGTVEQCTFRLRETENRMCAMGVFCDEYDPAGWAYNYPGNIWTYNGLVALVAEDIWTAYGLTLDDYSYVTKMNDHDKKTFPKIAQWIEETILPRGDSV